ncbi:gliding motility-associated C-terminal domain-containing protein [Chitinophaga sp.]|uniref:T9SS type B sorting domain-containing protein n=1 Tax=Chitinophaga sp. TaxID=1869181 RepID=UPI0031D7CFBA
MILLHLAFTSRAETFVVTSNADSGPGTLREALQKAAANGSTEKDYIHFNLPYTTWDERTIVLYSSLPEIGSNIVIDATMQPGDKLGRSDAGVAILRADVLSPLPDNRFFAFQIKNAEYVEIYGIALKHTTQRYYGYGITLENARHIRIGASGKGNLVYGFNNGFYNDQGTIEDLVVEGNMLGVEEDGITGSPCNIHLESVNGIVMQGNHLGSGGMDVNTTGGPLIVKENKIAVDYTGNREIRAYDVWLMGNADDIKITDNHIGNGLLYLIRFIHPFVVQRNKIGTDASGQQKLTTTLRHEVGLMMLECQKGLVGGENGNANIIAGCAFAGINMINCPSVTISANEMFCNTVGIHISWFEDRIGRPKPFVNITECSSAGTGGTATPNSRIELFQPDNCGILIGAHCQGRKYITSVTADANGKWFYPSTAGVVVTATDPQGATSEYSTVTLVHDESNKVTDPTCGKANGAIRMKVSQGLVIGWKDGAGNLISTDTSLVNVPPGTYTMITAGAGCNTCLFHSNFRLEDKTPSIDSRFMRISHSSCNQKNGFITGVYVNGTTANTSYAWRNEVGEIVGDKPELYPIGPGKYTLTVSIKEGDCPAVAGPFEIKSMSGPVLDISKAVVTPALCNQANGSIAGITVQGTGTVQYQWVNEAGSIVSTLPDLTGAAAGKYVLKYKDAGGCAQAVSDTFTLGSNGSISVSTANLKITLASCTADNGGISGIETTGATSFKWVNENGETVAQSPSLENAPPGKYRLLLSNAYGCEVSTAFMEVTRMQASGMSVERLATVPAHCGENNGAVTELVIKGSVPVAYRWVDDRQQLSSTEPTMGNLAPGTYQLHVTDAGGCEQLIATAVIETAPLPALDESQVKISPDQCNQLTGAISGITASGGQPISYTWYTGSNAVAGHGQGLSGIPAGDYYLLATDKYGCKAQSGVYNVPNVDRVLAEPQVQPVTILKGMQATLKVTDPLPGMYYLYDRPDANPLQYNEAGQFVLEGIEKTTPFYIALQSGTCISPRKEVMVNVVDDVKVVAATAFSPNNDGRNDRFRIHAYGLARLDYFTIFNRWGTPVFTTNDADAWWNGQLNNMPQSAGTYIWVVKGLDIRGNNVVTSGHVLLIR